ncbi:MAG TPA: glycosyltransferase [Phycisphaerae bacterium]|nr:glycosyltransferase [Phycisphaerae bacterium]
MIDPSHPDYADTPIAPGRPAFRYAAADPRTTPGVSIITPCHNVEEWYWRETAECVLRQSFQNFEWILVDDGSSDGASVKLLEAVAARDPRVRLIRQANAGPGAARNHGAREARGQFLLWLDADDLIEPTYIEKSLWCLISHPEFDFCNAWSVGFGDQEYLWPRGFNLGALSLRENQIDKTALVRRKTHLKIGGFDESLRIGHEDWDYWLSMASAGLWGWTMPEYLIWYRRRSSSRFQQTENDTRRRTAFLHHLWTKHARLYADESTFPNRPDPDPMAPARACLDIDVANPMASGQHRRLLFIVPWMTLGGADKFNIDVVEQLVRRGWEITIATTMPSQHEWMPRFARHTPDVFALSNFLRLVDYPRFLLYLLQSRGITHVLMSNSQLGYELLPYLRSHYPRAAFMDYCHSAPPEWKDGGYPTMAARWTDCLDLHVASSDHLRQYTIGRGARADRIEVCHTNIDAGQWRPEPTARSEARRSYLAAGESGERAIILWCGRLVSDKRPQFLVEILKALRDEGVDFLALLAGDGEHRPSVEEFVDRHKLGDVVRLLGAVRNDEVARLMAAADIFLLPSAVEGISLAIFEAMAMGVVPVSANIGGQSELVAPEVGFLIPHGKPEHEKRQYVDTLKRLVDDVPWRRRIGEAARRRIEERFTLRHMGERMHELLLLAETHHRAAPCATMPIGPADQCAVTSIERLRLELLADHLWLRLNRQQAAGRGERTELDPADAPISLVRAELGYIENSSSWRRIQRFRQSRPYRLWARLAHRGAGLAFERISDPRRRLAAIKASRFYRLLQAIKHTPVYRMYVRRKYGPEFVNPFPDRADVS